MLADSRLPNSITIGIAGNESLGIGHPAKVTGLELAR
jgi:hypothetical protein